MSRKKEHFDENKHSAGHGFERPSYGEDDSTEKMEQEALQEDYDRLFGINIQQNLKGGYPAYLERRGKFFAENEVQLKKSNYSTNYEFLRMKDELTKEEFENSSKKYQVLKEQASQIKTIEKFTSWKGCMEAYQIMVMLYLDDFTIEQVGKSLKLRETRISKKD